MEPAATSMRNNKLNNIPGGDRIFGDGLDEPEDPNRR